MEEGGITWHVLTHEHRDRSADWYWALGIFAIGGAAASIYFGNILLAIILVVGAGSIGVLAVRGPREHMVRVDKRGVTLDGTLYPYKSIQSFWVAIEENVPEDVQPRAQLFLTTNGFLHPYITIPLDDMEHAKGVRELLSQYSEEEEQYPHFGEQLAELFGL